MNKAQDKRMINRAGAYRVQDEQKHYKKRRSRSTVTLYIMVLLFMLTIGVVLIFTVFFKITAVNVEGLNRYEQQQVIDSSAIMIGENMFSLNRGAIEASLVKTYSYFEEVKLHYHLPDTITIRVREAQPVGAVQQGESFLLISQGGRVLESVVGAPPGVTVVKGFSALPVKAGETIDGMLEMRREKLSKGVPMLPEDSEEVKKTKKAEYEAENALVKELSGKFAMMRAFFASCGEIGFSGVNILDVSDQFNLVATSGKVIMEFGAESELTYKMQCVQQVFAEKLGDDFEGVLDASYPGKVRVRTLSAEAQGMTPDQYAEYLYKQSGGSVVTSQEDTALQPSPAPQTQQSGEAPKIEERQAEASSESENTPEEESEASQPQSDEAAGMEWEVIDVE